MPQECQERLQVPQEVHLEHLLPLSSPFPHGKQPSPQGCGAEGTQHPQSLWGSSGTSPKFSSPRAPSQLLSCACSFPPSHGAAELGRCLSLATSHWYPKHPPNIPSSTRSIPCPWNREALQDQPGPGSSPGTHPALISPPEPRGHGWEFRAGTKPVPPEGCG